MVIWSEPAKNALKQIFEYISQDSKYYAHEVVDTFLNESEKLNEFPNIGRIVPEINDEKIRELITYSYRMIYQVKNQNVEVLTIVHGKRDFKQLQ